MPLISSLPLATDVQSTDTIPIDQGTPPVTRKITVGQLVAPSSSFPAIVSPLSLGDKIVLTQVTGGSVQRVGPLRNVIGVYAVINPAVFDGITDASSVVTATMQAVVNEGGGWVLGSTGTALVGNIPWHPLVSLRGMGRQVTKFQCKPTATTCAFNVLARAAGTDAAHGYMPVFEDFRLDGVRSVGGTPANIDGILFEPASNDVGYDGTLDAAYQAGKLVNLEIHSWTGNGVNVSTKRHKFYMAQCRISDCAKNGMNGIADDPQFRNCIIESNLGHGIKVSGATGVLISGNRIYGAGGAARSDNALAMQLSNINGASVVGNTFGDTIWFNGANAANSDRGISVIGNDFRPQDNVFTSDGVPAGTANANKNCHIAVNGFDSVSISGNDFDATNVHAYRFLNLLGAAQNSHVNFSFTGSTQSGVQPWSTTAPVPVTTLDTSVVITHMTDNYAGVHRLNGQLVLSNSFTNVVDSTYQAYFGGTKQAFFLNGWATGAPSVYPSTSGVRTGISMTNGGTTVIAAGQEILGFGINNVATYTVTLPANPPDGRKVTITFRKTVGALTVNTTDSSTIIAPPTSAAVGTKASWIYDLTSTTWDAV